MMHQYVYVTFPDDGTVDEERIDDIAEAFDGKCCGSGTSFCTQERDLDYSFYDTTVEHIAAFMDALFATFPDVRARLGQADWQA